MRERLLNLVNDEGASAELGLGLGYDEGASAELGLGLGYDEGASAELEPVRSAQCP